MMTSDGPEQRSPPGLLRRLAEPRGRLAMTLVAAVVLCFAPQRLVDPLRSAWSSLLRPGQVATTEVVDFTSQRWERLQASWAGGERLVENEHEIEALRAENQRLSHSLEAARHGYDQLSPDRPHDSDSLASATEPLLRAEAIQVRVLGRTAQTFLRGRDLLDFGARSGANLGALVVDGNGALVDAGADLGLRPGRLVLAGRRVWGKLAAVSSQTSSVERLTDRGYRDTVQLVRHDPAGGDVRPGPRGMLAGNGEPLCRIELIETTDPVAVGDEVWTIADGVVTSPLDYGRIVRVERPAAGSHWQIWMAPAIGSDVPQQVAVLKLELNTARIADSRVRSNQ